MCFPSAQKHVYVLNAPNGLRIKHVQFTKTKTVFFVVNFRNNMAEYN